MARHPVGALAKWALDLHISGRQHLPPPPYVLAANHLSYIDPVLVTLVAGRNIRYLAVSGLFDTSRWFDRFISYFGAIPTPHDRAPVAAMRSALDELAAGNTIAVFPEGRRVVHWREGPPQRGAAWLALAAGVPLVPVAVLGSEGTLGLVESAVRRTSIRIWVEPPLEPLAFSGHADPIGAMGAAWLEVIGERLDPWWHPVEAEEAGGDCDTPRRGR